MRVVADTNVIVSGILWIGTPHTILIAAENARLTLYTSPALLQELEGVLKRPKFVPRLRDLQVTAEEVTTAYARLAHIVNPRRVIRLVETDPADDEVVACALAARDILIGGSGGDNLTGNGGDDLLIAGTTVHETNVRALCDIMSEWVRTDKTYSQRVSNLLNGGGLNGATKLNATTVFDDAIGDNLTGGTGTDWFFAKTTAPGPDSVISVAGETITVPGAPPAPLLAQGGARADDGSLAALTAQQLSPIVEEAKASWIASGLTAEQAATLSSTQFTITDLDGAIIGLTDGTSVLIDRTAAGHEWFIDPTPHDNAEFHFVRGLAEWIADAHSQAFSRMDLLTTVMHELGHVLGYGDQQTQRHSANLMTETLPTGVRRSLLADFPAGPVGQSPSSHNASVRELLNRSLTTFAGTWVSTGNGNGSATTTKPVIDWTEIDERDSRQKKTALGTSPQKASWPQRFLLHLGQDEAKPHDHGIEVVLPGKKK